MHVLQIPLAAFAASVLLLTPATQAQLSEDAVKDAAKELENRHRGEILRVRELVADSKIRYDSAGKLTGKWKAGRWTWHSSVELVGVEAKGRTLRIKANRLLLNYDQGTERFASVRAGTVEIEIETTPDINGKINLDKEWNKAFLTATEDYPLDMQPYWRPFISCILRPNTDECKYYETESQKHDVYSLKPAPPSGWKPSYPPGVYAIGPSIKPPKMLTKSEPQYTDVARQYRVSGTVILEVIIRKSGYADIFRVIRPLGYGLEESAAEWVLKIKFAPATLNDKPVDVHLQIVVNFQLY